MPVKLYTIHCPSCNVLEKKLKQNNIEFEIIDDRDKVIAKGNELGIKSAPILQVNNDYYNFIQAIEFLKGAEA